MNKKIILTLSAIMLFIASCKKTSETIEAKPKTPLHKIFEDRFLIESAPTLYVKYKDYNSKQDMDRKTLDASIGTVNNAEYGFDRVVVYGTFLETVFKRNEKISPSLIWLPTGSPLAKEIDNVQSWRGILTIVKTNNLVSQQDFEKGVSITLSGANFGDQITTLERIVTANQIKVVFELTKSATNFKQIYFKAQSNVAVSYKIEYDLGYAFNGSPRTIVPFPKQNITQPNLKDIGNNTTQFDGFLIDHEARYALSEHMAYYLWKRDVLPLL